VLGIRFAIIFWALALIACGTKTPAPPNTAAPVAPAAAADPPVASETIRGGERIGWEQAAADVTALAALRYAVYVDGARAELSGATCASIVSSSGFPCVAPLPALSAGPHMLELASFFLSGGAAIESGRSAPLHVTVVTTATSGGALSSNGQYATAPAGTDVVTRDGVRLRIELVAAGLDRPSDLAFAPDGRLFIAERLGRIRILRDGRLLPQPAVSLSESLGADGKLLALALDPQFDRTGFVFVLYTAPSRSLERTFCLARLREAADTLGERAVLIEGTGASPTARGSLRIGPDSKIYAAFDDEGAEAQRDAATSPPQGKILRLNLDGTTPHEQAGATPTYAEGYQSPGGFDWDVGTGTLWIADSDRHGSSRLRAMVSDPGVGRTGRGVVTGTYALPATASSTTFYRGQLFPSLVSNLLVASDEGRGLLRIRLDRLDPHEPSKSAGMEWLIQDRPGGVRAVAVGPDGAIYFATSTTIERLVPDSTTAAR
jgi:glucose/arabinose dehydrogenase